MRYFEKGHKYEVEVRCGLNREYWTSRKEAMAFYLEGAMCCDGSEAGRYLDIYSQLEAGEKIASDGMEPLGGWKD